jgi:biotin synthase
MTCSGGIVGMGENDDDLIELAFALRALQADSIPVNFLQAISDDARASRRRCASDD